MKSRFIVIDGKTYSSVDEMPPDVRQQYEQAMSSLKDNNDNRIPDALESATSMFADKNNNGVPDVLENMSSGGSVANLMKLIVNGMEYSNMADMPPEARAKLQQAMGSLDKNQNGIPDFVEQTMSTSAQASVMQTPITTPGPLSTPTPPQAVPSAITPDTSNGLALAALAGFLLLLCAAVVVGGWYFFLR